MRDGLRTFISVLTMMALLCANPAVCFAEEIFSSDGDEMKEDAIASNGWNEADMEAFEWEGLDGETYQRIYDYEEEMYTDTVTAHEQLALDYGILNLSDMTSGISGGYGSIVAVALREASAEDSAESPMGSNNVKYNSWYYGHDVSGDSYAWCVVFIIWCANECGYVDTGLFPMLAYCDGLYRYFLDEGFSSYSLSDCSQFGGDYTASPGDIVFFYSGDGCEFGHVGIVTGTGDGYMDVTQGNTSDQVLTLRYDTAAARSMYGSAIVHVEYPSGTSAIFSYLTGNMGLNSAAACGVLGNMSAESGCISYRVQGDFNPPDYPYSREYTDSVDAGSISRYEFVNNGPGGGGFGLCQWTSPNRKEHLYSLAKDGSTTYSVGDTYLQMMLLQEELEEGYSYVLSVLQSVPDTAQGVCDASDCWLVYFEAPLVNNYSERQSLSLQFWADYGGSA